MFFGGEERARAMENEAYERLQEGELDAAEALGSQLVAMSWSGGFEVLARVAHARGQTDLAIATLEDAVVSVPTAWPLWLLLATLRSDAGRTDAALLAFAEAVAKSEGEASVHYNRAVTYHRMGRPDSALDDLDRVLALAEPPPFAEDALGLALACLGDLGRHEEAVGLAQSTFAECAEQDPRRPRVAAELALVLARANASEDAQRAALETALDAGYGSAPLAALVRKLEPTNAPIAQRMRFVLQSDWPHAGAAGFFQIFDVVGTDETAALALCRRFVHKELRQGARTESCEVVEAHTQLEPGVHAVSARIFYEDDEA